MCRDEITGLFFRTSSVLFFDPLTESCRTRAHSLQGRELQTLS